MQPLFSVNITTAGHDKSNKKHKPTPTMNIENIVQFADVSCFYVYFDI